MFVLWLFYKKKYILLAGSFVDVGVHSQPCKDIYLFATKKNLNKIPEKGKSSLGSPELYDVKWGQKPQKDGTTFLTSNQNQGHDGDRL